MSHNPNNDELIKNALRQGDGLVESVFSSIKSQHELNPCNDGKRSSEVLIKTIDELEKTECELERVEKENKELKCLLEIYNKGLLAIGGLSLIGILMELNK